MNCTVATGSAGGHFDYHWRPWRTHKDTFCEDLQTV